MTVFHHLTFGSAKSVTVEEKYDVVNKQKYWIVTATDKDSSIVNLFLDYASLVTLQSLCNVAVLKHLGDTF